MPIWYFMTPGDASIFWWVSPNHMPKSNVEWSCSSALWNRTAVRNEHRSVHTSTHRGAEGLAGHHAVTPLDVEGVLQAELFRSGHVQEAPVQVLQSDGQLGLVGHSRRLLGRSQRAHADKQQQLHGGRLRVPPFRPKSLIYGDTLRPLTRRRVSRRRTRENKYKTVIDGRLTWQW